VNAERDNLLERASRRVRVQDSGFHAPWSPRRVIDAAGQGSTAS
jgi:hypothetical protein